MTLKKEITVGELLVLIGMMFSLMLFAIKIGAYKERLDTTLVAVQNMTAQINDIKRQSNQMQSQIVGQRGSIDELAQRVKNVEDWIASVRKHQMLSQ